MRATGNLAINVENVVEPQWVHDFSPIEVALSAARFAGPPEAAEGGEDEEQEEPEIFEPRPLKTRKLEMDRLGQPGCRADCFGCVYFGEKETTLPVDDITRLIEMARQSIGRVDMVALAEGMASYYAKMRQRINSELHPGEKPLPPWRAAQILEHLRMHHNDPMVQQVVSLNEIQEMRNEVADHCFERSNKTGRVRPNKHNIECYERLTKLQWHVQKLDTTKMAFSSHGARVNPEVLSQGVISYQTKRLHDYWKK
jgi:hypothetical protein